MAFYEFLGVVFEPSIQDRQPLISTPAVLLAERHVPYSDRTIVDKGGRLARRYASNIRVAPADLVAWEAALGQQGLLVVAGGNAPNSLLIKLDNHTCTPRGEFHFFDAEWIIGG